jgi:hypothetical protein
MMNTACVFSQASILPLLDYGKTCLLHDVPDVPQAIRYLAVEFAQCGWLLRDERVTDYVALSATAH